MAFCDVKKMNYEDYIRKTETVKPYRGKSVKAYPLDDRRYSARHFIVNDDKTISIYYSNLEWMEGKDEGDDVTRREQFPPHAIVHPDNTIEFCKVWNVVLLTKLLERMVCHRVQYGGSVIMDYHTKEIIPIFKGARYSLLTGECLTPYEWFHPSVNRKKAKEHLKRYETLKKLYGMYLKSMDKYGLTGLFNDLTEETGDKWENSDYFDFKKFEQMVDEMRHADAAVYISTHMKGWWWHKYNYEDVPDKFVHAVSYFMEKDFDKTIYKHAGEKVFDYTSIAKGKKMKGSKWKIVVKSNGQVVERL